MIQYARFSIECTSKRNQDRCIYKEIQYKLKKYLLDFDMQLYRVPVLSDEYSYVHELSLQYSWDENRKEDRDEFPGLYVTDAGFIETKYSKEDFTCGVAYMVNFWYFAYIYDDIALGDYIGDCCASPKWKYQDGLIQNKTPQIPSSEFKKKKYAQLYFGFAVDEEIVKLLIENGLAESQDFLEIKNKKGKIVCYQINPQNVISGFARDNSMSLVDRCDNCGLERYEYEGEPFYISKETLSQLKGINQTKEVTGPIIVNYDDKREEKLCSIVEPWYIVNEEVYNLLKRTYPRMQFIPIFPK